MKEDKSISFASVVKITKASRIFELQNYANPQCLSFINFKKQEYQQKEINICFVEDNDPADYYF